MQGHGSFSPVGTCPFMYMATLPTHQLYKLHHVLFDTGSGTYLYAGTLLFLSSSLTLFNDSLTAQGNLAPGAYKCYIGPCGVLVPMGTVHSNNEFEFEVYILNFLGVGRRHPLVSLQFEMDMLPVRWEALRRGIEFWVQVMRMNDDRLVKVVMLEALEIGSKVKWVKELQQVWRSWGGED